MSLVWPVARWPFDPQQWQEALDPEQGHVSFVVRERGRTIGHAALRKWEPSGTYRVSFLYILQECRSRGVGQQMLAALESYALHRLGAQRLTLVARDFNLPAINCYLKCGFRQTAKTGTQVDMEKVLGEQPPAELAGQVVGWPPCWKETIRTARPTSADSARGRQRPTQTAPGSLAEKPSNTAAGQAKSSS